MAVRLARWGVAVSLETDQMGCGSEFRDGPDVVGHLVGRLTRWGVAVRLARWGVAVSLETDQTGCDSEIDQTGCGSEFRD